jgi:hypothetical protein
VTPRIRGIALVASAALVWALAVAVAPTAAAAPIAHPAAAPHLAVPPPTAPPKAPPPFTGPLPSGDLLVPNFGFEGGTADWTRSCSAASGVTTDQRAEGNQAAYLRSIASCPVPTITSAPLPATPGLRYTAFLQTLSQSGTATVNLVFLDAARRVIGQGPPTHTGQARWTMLRPSGIAPEKARYVAVRIGATTSSGGTVYADDVRISRQFTDLGPQLYDTYVRAITFGKDAGGRDVVYAVTDGNGSVPAHLVVVEVATGVIQRWFNLNTSSPSGSWAATTATDGTIYVASFQPGALWAYKPGAPVPVRVATILGDQIPFAIAPGTNASVYVGGYPDGVVYKYMPGKGLTTFVNAKKLTGQQYVRSLAVDLTTRIVYVGVGTKAGLLACNEQGATCTDITPPAFRGQQFAYQIAAGPGKAFVYLSPSNDLVVLDVTKQSGGSIRATVASTIKGVSYPGASPAFDGKAYYRDGNGLLVAYDLATDTTTQIATSYPAPRGWASLALADQSRYPGQTVLSAGSITGGLQIAGANPTTGAALRKSVTGMPGASVGIETLQRGPDENVYASGYLVGGLASYTPMRADRTSSYQGIGQAEGMATLGGYLYLGIYPGASIGAYSPSQPVAAGANPKKICDLAAQRQDRPYGMVAGGGKLYIGTMGGYGNLKGGLTVYDPATGQCTFKGDLVGDESIVSLAYQDGIVYGGSLVWGGLGIAPTQTHARLVIYDTRTDQARTVPLPVTAASVQGLMVGPSRNIWMMAQDWLLIYSPSLGRFVYQGKPFGDVGYPKPPLTSTNRISAYDVFLARGADGGIYGTYHGRYFFKLDPRTAKATVLYQGAVGGLTTDAFGNLYFIRAGDRLVRYVP